MHNRIGRLVAAVIAAVLTLLAAPVTEAIAIAPAESLSTYACDGHHHPALVTGVVTERGPPAVHRLLTTRDAADPWSPGASVCSDERPSRAVATYDDPARFVKVARATSTTDGRVEVISVCPFDFERGRGAANARPADSPHYSVAHETRLDASAYPGRSDKFHFAAANRNLDEAFQADPGYAASMDGLFPGITDFVRPGPHGAYPRRSPAEPGLTWHHQTSPGVMQLIPTAHHMAPGSVQASLHPGGVGGMALWGGGR